MGEIGRIFGMSFPEPCFKFTIDAEGGYSNDPNDPGLETKYGISKAAHPDVDIKNLTKYGAMKIYKEEYWDPYKCGSFAWPLSLAYFDFLITTGSSAVIIRLQRAINYLLSPNTEIESLLVLNRGPLKVDGIIGPKTIKAGQSLPPISLANTLTALRLDYYISLPQFSHYGRGWSNRIRKMLMVIAKSKE